MRGVIPQTKLRHPFALIRARLDTKNPCMKVEVASPFLFPAEPDVLCSECGANMVLRKRTPNAEKPGLEDQFFFCPKCKHAASRSVDQDGAVSNRKGL
jgi:hypothetical protein